MGLLSHFGILENRVSLKTGLASGMRVHLAKVWWRISVWYLIKYGLNSNKLNFLVFMSNCQQTEYVRRHSFDNTMNCAGLRRSLKVEWKQHIDFGKRPTLKVFPCVCVCGCVCVCALFYMTIYFKIRNKQRNLELTLFPNSA